MAPKQICLYVVLYAQGGIPLTGRLEEGSVESGAGSGRSASAPGGGGAPSVAWVGEVVSSVLQDPRAIWTKPGMGWEQVKDGSLWYLAWKKVNHRFDDRGQYDRSKAATWDMVLGAERTP
ncbi:hypothetical protein GMORB2_7725 [Geosmithia morbida]|uniref:Uncharacterized protein n=1 Tax=Geosmithia morbida TaxID=1094350 RepID=A0A9P5D0Y2_9HYPO|nr:uncharacterized protein GMORB2_7725 [Geosmithia morbida]KAF4122132.1 hypothetical protein GMORB2_7725 [Geosmithia morbida]